MGEFYALACALVWAVAVLFFRRNCGAELTAFRGFGIWDVPAIPPAIAVSMAVFVLKLTFLTLAWRHLPRDEASRLDRARTLGEKVTETTG